MNSTAVGWRRIVCVVTVCVATSATHRAQAQAATVASRKVTIVGASVSAGFSDQFLTARTAAHREHNATLRLQAAIEPLFAPDKVAVTDLSTFLMFQQPERYGARQVEKALQGEPDLVLAIDFMFWFGYCIRGGDQKARLALQEQGLACLAKVKQPLLVGDYPEMRDADPRMMGPHVIPDDATLRALNDGLHAWAKARPNVRVFALSKLITELRETKCVVALGDKSYELEPADLLQTDRLHATRLGMAVLALNVTQAMQAMLQEDNAVVARARSLPEIISCLELEDLLRADGALVPSPAKPRDKVEVGRE